MQLGQVLVPLWGTSCGLALVLSNPPGQHPVQQQHTTLPLPSLSKATSPGVGGWTGASTHRARGSSCPHSAGERPVPAPSTISFSSEGSCLAPAGCRDIPGQRGTPGLGALGNSPRGSTVQGELSAPLWKVRWLQTPACAWGNISARSPARLQAAPSCVSGTLSHGGIHAHCGAALIHGEVKHPLFVATGMCHHPGFLNYLKVLPCRTRPWDVEEQMMKILAVLQHCVLGRSSWC